MKKLIVMFVVGLLIQQIIQAQGTVYVSNLGQSSAGSEPVGSDSWLAAGFKTGTNVDGYELNSIQLAMTGVSGNPTDFNFTVMIYANINPETATFPGSSLGTLDGSDNPSTAGIYTYTVPSNLTLSPNTYYYIVLTAGTAIANGAYDWSVAVPNSYSLSDGWIGFGSVELSSNGSSWNSIGNTYLQYAISATAVPEPGVFSLAAAGGLCFLWRRRKTASGTV